MIASVTEPSLKVLNSAVQARDSKAFDKAWVDLTDA